MQEFLPGGERSPTTKCGRDPATCEQDGLRLHLYGVDPPAGGVGRRADGDASPVERGERTTGADASDARAQVDDRFEAAREASDRAEDRFLTVVLSTSQLTAEYARFVDDSFERACPVGDEVAN